MDRIKRFIALAAFNERVQGLLDDGYHVMFKSAQVNNDLLFASLRHHNGNRINVKAYVRDNKLIQTTNHIVTLKGTLYQS